MKPAFFAITACLFVVAGCNRPTKPFSEKKLIIATNQTVKIKELDLSITNNGCGRQWESGSERPYCELIIKHKESTINAGNSFEPVHIGNIEITIDKMNPWGRQEDSVPAGGCRLLVRKL